MIDQVQEAQELLDSVKQSLPWRFDAVQQPEKWAGSDVQFGAIRTKDSRNVVQPFEGSSSIMMGIKPMIDFVIKAPAIIQTLMEEVNRLGKENDNLKTKNETLTEIMGQKLNK